MGKHWMFEFEVLHSWTNAYICNWPDAPHNRTTRTLPGISLTFFWWKGLNKLPGEYPLGRWWSLTEIIDGSASHVVHKRPWDIHAISTCVLPEKKRHKQCRDNCPATEPGQKGKRNWKGGTSRDRTLEIMVSRGTSIPRWPQISVKWNNLPSIMCQV